MRVLLNATDGPLSLRAIRRYVLEMIAGLGHPASGVDLEIVFFTHRLLRVRDFLKKLPAGTRYRARMVPLPRRILNERHASPRFELRRLAKRVDIYHETTTDNPCFNGIPVLTTVHGCAPLVRPDILPAEFVRGKVAWFDRAFRMSQYFTTVSETSAREFMHFYPALPHRVVSIPLGVSAQYSRVSRKQARADVGRDFGLDGPYILYVGGIQENKNVALVLRVFRRLLERGCFAGKLVLAGDMHYRPADFAAMVAAEGIGDHVKLAGYFDPEDARLATLYRGASLFLFPTFYEGWTSPPLEAMACGVPVIASSASSIPETVGDGGLLVDPCDEEAWVEAASGVLADPAVAESLADAGARRAAQFPWSRTVNSTIQLYQDILSGKLERSALSFGAVGAGRAGL